MAISIQECSDHERNPILVGETGGFWPEQKTMRGQLSNIKGVCIFLFPLNLSVAKLLSKNDCNSRY